MLALTAGEAHDNRLASKLLSLEVRVDAAGGSRL
jgi:hypothetical protein